MVVLQVPADGVRAGVQARLAELFTQGEDPFDRGGCGGAGPGVRGAGARLERGLTLGGVARL